LGNTEFFSALKKKSVVINSCRGEVVETLAVKNALKNGQITAFVCDCWEHEPDLDLELLALTEIATPHIAGYSKDGKATGTEMSVHAISRFFNLGLESWHPSGIELPEQPVFKLDGSGLNQQQIISKAILHTYDIRNDDTDFRKDPSKFEQLRGDYPTRREFPAFTIIPRNLPDGTLEILKKIGFNIQTT
jgi:erythronate-4-phosphate dehydrogenase